MSNQIIEKLLAKTKRSDIPAFAPGDTVRVNVKIKDCLLYTSRCV